MGFIYGAASVRGALHEKRGIACEDACGVWSGEQGDVWAIAVADGHGDPACIRSAVGAQVAVGVALRQLQELARLGPDKLASLAPGSTRTQHIAANVAGGWRARVLAHLRANPLAASEAQGLDWEQVQQSMLLNPTHIYGTTLVAALVVPGMCIFMQQGDGCCGLISSDGKVWHPVPDDELCVGNVTTSMADSDAADRMRFGVVKVGEKSLLGCFAVSDGIEKSYASQGDLDEFFRYLATELQGKDQLSVNAYLEGVLAEVSTWGSQDDASIACVMDAAASQNSLAALDRLSERQRIVSELEELRTRLVSMQRKHAILEKLWVQGQRDEAKEYPAYHASWKALKQSEADLEEQLEAMGE